MITKLLRFLAIAVLWRCLNGQGLPETGSGSGTGVLFTTTATNETEVTTTADEILTTSIAEMSGTTTYTFESSSISTDSIFESSTNTSGTTSVFDTSDMTSPDTTQLIFGSGDTTTTENLTTASLLNNTFEGSAMSTATTFEGSAMSTDTTFEGSGMSTGTTETTVVASINSVVDTTFEGSAVSTDTTECTTFVPATGTDQFNATSGAVLATGGVLEWYFIVIICLGIIIFIILLILIFCCWKHYCSNRKSFAVKSNKLINETESEEIQLKLLKASPIEKPGASTDPVLDKEIIPTVIVKPTPLAHDPSLTVRKRDVRPRPVSKIQVQIEEDEGFIEPQREKQFIPAPIARPAEPPALVYMPRSLPRQNTAVVEEPSPVVLPSRDPFSVLLPSWDPSPVLMPSRDHQQFNHGLETVTLMHPVPQQYIFPPVRETFLATSQPQQSVQSRAMAENQALTRSEIERHKNKQRLRRQRSMNSNGKHDSMRKEIDAVLAPGLPSVFRLETSRSKKQQRLKGKHSHDARDVNRPVPPTRPQPRDVSADDSTTTSRSVSPEATIRKMTKLLEQAYSIIAPALQKNAVDLVPQQQTGPMIPAAAPPHPERHLAQSQSGSESQMPPRPIPDQMLFTRRQAPAALLPGSGQPDSILWSPYRTFDELMRLQADASLTSQPTSSTPNTGSFGQQFHSSGNSVLPGTIPPVAISMPETVQRPVNGVPGHQTLRELENSGIPVPDTARSDSTESTASLVRSIKESLARLTGSSTQVQNIVQADESAV